MAFIVVHGEVEGGGLSRGRVPRGLTPVGRRFPSRCRVDKDQEVFEDALSAAQRAPAARWRPKALPCGFQGRC